MSDQTVKQALASAAEDGWAIKAEIFDLEFQLDSVMGLEADDPRRPETEAQLAGARERLTAARARYDELQAVHHEQHSTTTEGAR